MSDQPKHNIRNHVIAAIADGLNAKMTQRNGQSGALFMDEDEFIPFYDLNYNSEIGYFRISRHPDQQQDCDNSNPETIHLGEEGDFDTWKPYVWADSDGRLTLLGEIWQVADLYWALGDLLHSKKLHPDRISENDPGWQFMYRHDISWAVSQYRRATGDKREDDQVANTIRAAASAGRIEKARQDTKGFWYFQKDGFTQWLTKTVLEKRGRASRKIE